MVKRKPFLKSIILLTLCLSFLSVSPIHLNGKSFLWEVNYNGTKSYLLGSIHMMKKNIFPLKKEIEDAFSNSNYLVVEADISSGKTAELLKLTFENANYRDKTVLKDHLTETTYQLVKEKMDELGMSINHFKTFKSWFVAMTITSMELVKLGFNPNFGIDKYFIERGKDKKIVELEGIKFQMELFNNFSDKENESFLLSTVKEASSLGKNIDKMVEAWKDGAVDKMVKFVNEDRGDNSDMEDVFKVIIEKRNLRMSEKISTLIKEGKSCFVIVGAAHLIGKEGVVNLLMNMGFKIKQI